MLGAVYNIVIWQRRKLSLREADCNAQGRAEETAQWVHNLLCKDEGLSSIPRAHIKSQGCGIYP